MKETSIKLMLGKQKYEVVLYPDGFDLKRNGKVQSSTYLPKKFRSRIQALILEKLIIYAVYDINHELEKVL